MKELPIEWVAGFFDGEGCAKIGKQAKAKSGVVYPRASLMLSQSGEDGLVILEQIQKQFGGKIYHHLKVGEHKATKNAYKLYWNSEDGLAFLSQIIPYLRLKQHDARLVKEYYERNKDGSKTV
jgi:hypothetical protein